MPGCGLRDCFMLAQSELVGGQFEGQVLTMLTLG